MSVRQDVSNPRQSIARSTDCPHLQEKEHETSVLLALCEGNLLVNSFGVISEVASTAESPCQDIS